MVALNVDSYILTLESINHAATVVHKPVSERLQMTEVLALASKAEYPALYSAARKQLAEFHRVDECKDIADKMAALAVYVKQVHDDKLENLVRRIKGRAVLRMGQILKSIKASPGARTDKPDTAGGTRLQTRTQAAKDAGISKRQADDAKRVATLHEQDPDRAEVMLESGASVTKMAEAGTKKRQEPPEYLEGRDPSVFNQVLNWVGTWEHAAERDELMQFNPKLVGDLTMMERDRLLRAVRRVKVTCDEIEAGITMAPDRARSRQSRFERIRRSTTLICASAGSPRQHRA